MFVYHWFVATSPRSWVAHALASLACCCAFEVAYGLLLPSLIDGLGWITGAWVAAWGYALKEWRDWQRYQRNASWRKPRWNRISPAQDIWGDLIGPFTVLAASVLQFLF